MAWTYDSTALADNELYQVRFLIGDTNVNDPLLQDEEINFTLSEKDTVIAAAITCCERIAAAFARMVDHKLGPYSVSNSQKARHYTELAKKLTKQIAKYNVPAMSSDQAGSIFDKDMMQNNTCDHGGLDGYDD